MLCVSFPGPAFMYLSYPIFPIFARIRCRMCMAVSRMKSHAEPPVAEEDRAEILALAEEMANPEAEPEKRLSLFEKIRALLCGPPAAMLVNAQPTLAMQRHAAVAVVAVGKWAAFFAVHFPTAGRKVLDFMVQSLAYFYATGVFVLLGAMQKVDRPLSFWSIDSGKR